ncbi:MAG: class I SAM-dependent methyltransferase [Anaerolineaceae bacterium]
MDIREHNRSAWDQQVKTGNEWTVPVSPETIRAARQGEWEIVLTPTRAVPRSWFPPLAGARVLCLAGAGGQQGPILAAAGAIVTVFDNSPNQLNQDRMVAEREGLGIELIEGDMRDLSVIQNNTFDLIFHPCSNVFIPDIQPVWEESFRVLQPGGTLLSGIVNPVMYIFDNQKMDQGIFEVRYSLPYSDLTSLTQAELNQYIQNNEPLEFSHTLGEQIGGQLKAGFLISGFYEDCSPKYPLCKYMPTFIATCAIKPLE